MNKHMKQLFYILLALMPNFLAAQNIIQGLVTDSRNNEPLIGAVVSCKDLKLSIATNADGGFAILSPASQKKKYHVITVKYIGYKPKSKAIEIFPFDGEKNVILDFKLEPDPLLIQDVTVTANKVEEQLQNVPIAATVVDRLNLRRRTVADTEEAFAMIPNLVTDAYLPSRTTFSLRGLSSDFENLGIENAVGLYIDDVFYSRSYNFNQSLMDIERVEVLRGPQGTLFGKNTIGGVLHVISEEPKMANFTSIEFNAGNFNYLQARIKGNMELIEDKMAIRITGAYRKRDGWMLEQNPEVADQNGVLFFGGRASLLYKPSDKLKISLKGTFARDDQADFTVDYKTPDNGIDPLGIDSVHTNPYDRIIEQNEEDVFFERRNRALVGRMDLKLDEELTLTSITSYTKSNGAYLRDFDATPVPAAVFGKQTVLSALGQEIRVATPREGRKLFLIGGLFFQHEKIDIQDTLVAREAMAPVFGAAIGQPAIDIPGYLETSNNTSIITSTNVAAFASSSLEVTERVRLNAGLRYTIENKEIDYWQTCNCPVGLLSALVSPSIGSKEEPITRAVNIGAISGNVGADFKTTDNMLLYINLSRGFKGAGFNAGLSPDADPEKAAFVFDPEFINSYEFGLKVKSGNRFTFNAAAFITDFQNKQETVAAGNSILVRNAESVQGQGVEAEFVGVWNKFLKTEIAVGALNLKYTNFPFVDPFTFEPTNLSGNSALKAPNFNFKFSPEIHSSLGRELKFLLRFDFNYIGKAYNDIFNTESLARQGAATLNSRLSISSKNERFSIAIWAKNITNTDYVQHGWSFIFGDQISLNPPRMLGVEFRANIY